MRKYILFIVILFFNICCVNAKEEVKFLKCIDGDTIRVLYNDEDVKVRMLAIDTPETVNPNTEVQYYGKEASDYTCNMVSNANILELEFDDNSDRYDKYNRLLAWIFVDGSLLNNMIVRNGYGEVKYLYGNYKYTDILEESESFAKSEKLGIWNNNVIYNYYWYIVGVVVLIVIITGFAYYKTNCGKVSKIG